MTAWSISDYLDISLAFLETDHLSTSFNHFANIIEDLLQVVMVEGSFGRDTGILAAGVAELGASCPRSSAPVDVHLRFLNPVYLIRVLFILGSF